MFLTLESRRPCSVCGHQIASFLMARFRVNKRSLRQIGTALGWRERVCPACASPCLSDDLPRVYHLTESDVPKVQAYRLRKWPDLAKEGAAP